MLDRSFMARRFLVGGGMLAVTSFILWFGLPIRMSFPPYLLTAVLALAYGAFCLKSNRSRSRKKS